ncbi:MAG: O-antigen ligase family protein [Hyphomonadaceae bacterium]|jgi:hypothetical protein|nr:O-antigen ligase family protein [Hyphomonadaceae bacterium]
MQLSSTIDKIGYFLLTTIVVAAPIPFGSSSTISAGVVGLVLALCLLGLISANMLNEQTRLLLWTTAALSAVVVVSALAHARPWGMLSMVPHAWNDPNAPIAGVSSLPASRYQPLHSAGYVLIPLVGFMCALIYISNDGRYMRFIQVVLAANAVITMVCLVQYTLSPRSLLWTHKHHYVDSFTGTFVNPNTAATHFGFLLLVALSLALRQVERATPSRLLLPTSKPSARDRRILGALLAYAAAALVFGIALVLTKSRAGVLSSFAGVAAFVAAFTYFTARHKSSTTQALGASALATLATVAMFAMFGERVLLRVETLGLIEQGRLCTYTSTWNAIKDGPWWGTGLGTFQDVFPSFRSPACGLYGHWEMAHSVFLEGWLSLGVVFLACVAVTYYHLLRTYGRGVRDRRRFRFVPLCCLSLLFVLTLHSLVDFSLQVLGFALSAAAILGAGAGVAARKRRTEVP